MKISTTLTRTTFACFVASCFFVVGPKAQGQENEMALASGGKALSPITIAPASSEEIRATATRLAEILQEITGAEFSIQEKVEPEGITLGTLSQFPDPTLTEDLEIRDGYNGVEAYAIRTGPEGVRLIGATDLGASHAVFRFLEHIGYRYFFMGPDWEIAPSIKELSFSLNESSRPAIWSRRMGFTRMRIPFDEGDPNREEIYEAWQAANLMGQSLRVATNHVWHAIPNAFRADDFPYKQAFEDNPEMYALVDGKRKPPQFCVTNEELQAIVIDYTQRFFKHNPEAEMVSLDPADGPGWCECKPCSEKFARPGDQAFFLADMAARKLQETHPGKYVGILAYSWHSEPPDFDLAPNVFVQLTAGMNSTELSFEDLLTGWSKRSEKMGIYEYFTYWEMDRGMPPGKGPQNRIDDLANRLKNYIENNVINITAEAGNSWGAHGLGYYIASRLMWNPKADLSALKNDFYETAFGPAASAMERYFERMNLSNNPFQGRILLRQSLDDLEDALRLAKGDPEALKRVEDMATLLIYSDLGQRVENSRDDAEKEALALEWFRWAYRIRNSYMVDWATFRAAVGNHTYARTLAAEFNRPDWNYRHTDENPWRDTTPITSEEIASRLAKLREEWGDTPQLADPKFQGQPVLVTVDGNGPRHTKHWFTAAAQYALASKEGEPLRFTLTSNPTPGVERQPARYFLTDLSGEVIHRGIFPLGENSVELEVPGPGIYLFTCRRGGRGWVMDFPDTLQGAILPNRDDDFRPNNLTTYFYVPKGEKEIVLYVESGSALVRDAEGTVVHQGQAIGDLVFIPVPDGTDGAVWSLRGKMRNLWFLNIPTMLSVDPTMVFVPQDLAEKDGLPVVVATPGLSQ